MYRNSAGQAQSRGGTRHSLGVFQTKDRGRELMAKCVFFFSRVQTAKHQNAPFDARLAQQHAFVGRGHAKPLRPCLLQRRRTLLNPMAVSVALHNSAYGHLRADVLLNYTEVMAQSRERNLGPVGTGLDARGCKRRGQISMIQAAVGGSLVVSGLVSGFVLLFLVGGSCG